MRARAGRAVSAPGAIARMKRRVDIAQNPRCRPSQGGANAVNSRVNRGPSMASM